MFSPAYKLHPLLILSVLLSSAACDVGKITYDGIGSDAGNDLGADANVGGETDANGEPTARLTASGIQTSKISIYQAVEVTIFENGDLVTNRNAPIVGGADALVGVFIGLEQSWVPREVTGVLTLKNSETESEDLVQTMSFTANTGADPRVNGFTFQVPGALLTTQTEFSFEIKEFSADVTSATGTPSVRIPADGAAALGVVSANGSFNLTLVPFQYDADGSGRLPPMDAAAQAKYVEEFESMFPISSLAITVRAPVPYENAITGQNGNSWALFLDRLQTVRAQDNPPANTYYYGIAAPTDSFGQFCSGGCISGLGNVPGPNSASRRASVGVSFSGRLNIGTALHEVGHTLGRQHSPCGGAGGPDPAYPYAGGLTGGVGYDKANQEFYTSQATDFMGYCNNEWISDYTFKAIFERIAHVNQGVSQFAPQENIRYRVGLVDGDGNITWTRYIEANDATDGSVVVDIALFNADDEYTADTEGYFFAYDHIEGGTLLVPVQEFAPLRIEVESMATAAW